MKYIKYLNYIIKHKWFVLIECWKIGLYWQGIIHDWSKLFPSEFLPYAEHFFGDFQQKRDETGYYKPHDTGDKAFDFAWFLHQKRNPHHWQYWILPLDEEGLMALEMPNKFRKEMLCDWRGAGKAQGTKGVDYWYSKNKHKLQLHNNTRKWIEHEMSRM